MISGVPTNAITNWKWSIPGANGNTNTDTAIYDYEPTAQNSNYTNLVTPTNYLTNASGIPFCNFYFTAPGTNQISCTTVIYGQTNTVSTTVNVLGPASKINVSLKSIVVSTNYVYFDSSGNPQTGFPYLSFGLNQSTNVGVAFSQTSSSPSRFAGTNEWVQVINGDYETNTTASGPYPHLNTGGCDTYYPEPFYPPGSSGDVDSPASPLFGDCTKVSRNFTATTYLMWMPYSTNAALGGDNAVWVPVRSYHWNWNGTATNSGTGWVLASSSPPATTNDAVCTNQPTWQTNSADNWVPPPSDP
jgi:hypothetical protein